MTRIHYSARPRHKAGAGAYHGVRAGSPSQKPVLVPVVAPLVECPGCHGGVRIVTASFADREAGIRYRVTKLYGSHAPGGHVRAKDGIRCWFALAKVES